MIDEDMPTATDRISFDPTAVEYRDCAEGESFYNYLGFREVDDDEKVRITNAYLSGKLIGSIKSDHGQTEGGVCFIQHVYVAPDYRGRGIMAELAHAALYEAAWDGYTTLGGAFEDEGLRGWFERKQAAVVAQVKQLMA